MARSHGARLNPPVQALSATYLGSLLALTAGIDRFEGTVGGHYGQSSAVQAVVH